MSNQRNSDAASSAQSSVGLSAYLPAVVVFVVGSIISVSAFFSARETERKHMIASGNAVVGPQIAKAVERLNQIGSTLDTVAIMLSAVDSFERDHFDATASMLRHSRNQPVTAVALLGRAIDGQSVAIDVFRGRKQSRSRVEEMVGSESIASVFDDAMQSRGTIQLQLVGGHGKGSDDTLFACAGLPDTTGSGVEAAIGIWFGVGKLLSDLVYAGGDRPLFNLMMWDVTTPSKPLVVFDGWSAAAGKRPSPDEVLSAPIMIQNRSFVLAARQLTRDQLSPLESLSWRTLFGLLGLTTVLAAYMVQAELRTVRIERLVAAKAEELVVASRDTQEHKRQLNDFVQQSYDLIQHLTPDGKIVNVNAAWKRVMGYDDADLATLTIFDLIHPSDHEHARQVVQGLLAGESAERIHLALLAKDGQLVDVEGHAQPQYQNGAFTSTRCTFQDATRDRLARKALHQSEGWMRAIVNAIADAIVTLDDRGVIHSMNPAAERIFGYSSREVVGEHFRRLILPPPGQDYNSYIRSLLHDDQTATGWQRMEIGLRKDAHTFAMSMTFSRAFVGDDPVYVAICRNDESAQQRSKAESSPLKLVGADEEAPETDVTSDRPVVLVIDDDKLVQHLVRDTLQREGYDVITASNGEEGLQLARQHHPMTITLDVLMPGTVGWVTLAKLKSDPELADIPIVMMTVTTDKKMGYALGVTEFLTKPINTGRLATMLNQHRDRQQTHPVMIVDDDQSTRAIVCTSLAKQGWRTIEAANGREALELLETEEPTLIVLDLIMPEMDGFQFLDAVSDDSRWRHLPVIVMTTKDVTPAEAERLGGRIVASIQKNDASQKELLHMMAQRIRSYMSLAMNPTRTR